MKPTNESILEQNVERLLGPDLEQPSLDPERRAAMLDALKEQQRGIAGAPAASGSKPLPWRAAVIGIVALTATIAVLVALRGPHEPSGPSVTPPQHPDQPEIAVAPDDTAREDPLPPAGGTRTNANTAAREAAPSPVRGTGTLVDGTRVIAKPGARWTETGPRSIQLDTGDLYLIVAKTNAPFVVTTPQGRVEAHGTRFAVSTAPSNDITEVAVAQGLVKLTNPAGVVALRRGEQGRLRGDDRPVRGPAPRLTHVVNWAREQLAPRHRLVEKKPVAPGLVAVDPWGQEARLSLRHYHVDVHIEDGIARTTVDQIFFNHHPANTEGTFVFPLPPDASVSRLAMYVNGVLNEGGMVERTRGQQIYNKIRFQRRDPALLELMEGNVFKLRIFPIEGRQEKRILLSFTQTLEELYGSLRYWFPMDQSEERAGQYSIKIRVVDGADRYTHESSTHIFRRFLEDGDLLLKFAAADRKPDQDILLRLNPARDTPTLRFASHQQGGETFAMARVTPTLAGQPEPKPRQWFFLNDISASRARIDLQAQTHILRRFLAEADDEDEMALFQLNTRMRAMGDLVPIRSPEAAAQVEAASEAMPLGATDLAEALSELQSVVERANAPNPVIVYLGDGIATDGERDVARLLARLRTDVPFVGIGVGKKVDRRFLRAAADHSGGVHVTMNANENLDWRVFDLLAALNTPRLTDVKAEFLAEGEAPDPAEAMVAYQNRTTLADGETLVLTARGDRVPNRMRVRGRLNGEEFEEVYPLPGQAAAGGYIPRFWAKRHLDELLKEGAKHRREIVRLSQQYYVVTPFTSLIVLEDDKMYEEFQVEKGRRDHWALYVAPPRIPAVREPLRPGAHWWFRDPSTIDRDTSVARPATVKQIVDSVQFRANAPFYFYPRHQTASSDARYALYRLAEQREIDPEILARLFNARPPAAETADERAASDSRPRDDLLDVPELSPLHPVRQRSRNDLLDSVELIPTDTYEYIPPLGPLGSRERIQIDDTDQGFSKALRFFNFDRQPGQQFAQARPIPELRPALEDRRRARREDLRRSSEERHRAGWGGGRPDGLELRDTWGGLDWVSATEITKMPVGEDAPAPPPTPLVLPPMDPIRPRSVSLAWFPDAERASADLPGLLAALAQDVLLAGPNTPAVQQAVAGLGERQAQVEDTSPFWSSVGWSAGSKPWTLPLPWVQTYPGYSWSFDLTRYAHGLASTEADVTEEVLAEFGGSTSGPTHVAPEVVAVIERSRAALPTQRLLGDGFEALAFAGGRFEIRRRTDMYLDEYILGDGQHIVHHYPELGLAARRAATPNRRAQLRRMFPHLLPPVEAFASFQVALGEAEPGTLTLIVTHPRASNETLRVVATTDGRLREQALSRHGTNVWRVVWDHGDGQVRRRVLDAADAALDETVFDIASVKAERVDPAARLEDAVVFDMPVRRPNHYEGRIEVETNEVERLRLLRHLALSELQEFEWQRYGGRCLPAIKAMAKVLAAQPKRGDFTLMASSGRRTDLDLFAETCGLADDDPLVQYHKFLHRGDWELFERTTKADPESLIGHLAAYQACMQQADLARLEHFVTGWTNSPLHYAAAHNMGHANGRNWNAWRTLMKRSPAWRIHGCFQLARIGDSNADLGMVLHQWLVERAEAGQLLPLNPTLVEILDRGQGAKALLEVYTAIVDASGSPGLQLLLAESAYAAGDEAVAERAIRWTRAQLSERPQLARLAIAQCLWSAGRHRLALAEYEDFLAALESAGLPPSAALLATMARLAKQADETAKAIDHEERALALEFPHLPDMIDIESFERRYNWLWGQYHMLLRTGLVSETWLARAEATWRDWVAVDPGNASLYRQMATLRRRAGRGDDEQWLYLSSIIDRRPNEAGSHHQVAEWLVMDLELGRALPHYERAFAVDSANPEWLYRHGELLEKLDRKKEARAMYERIVLGEWASGFDGWVGKAEDSLRRIVP